MKQTDLIDWLDSKRVITSQPPALAISHRAFTVEQLAPIMHELESLGLSPAAIADALHFYAKQFRDKAQDQILNA